METEHPDRLARPWEHSHIRTSMFTQASATVHYHCTTTHLHASPPSAGQLVGRLVAVTVIQRVYELMPNNPYSNMVLKLNFIYIP